MWLKQRVWLLVFLSVFCVEAKKNKQKQPEAQKGELFFAPHFKKVLIDVEKADIAIDVIENGERASVSYEQKPFAKDYAFFCEVHEDTLIIKFKKQKGWFKFFAPTSTITLFLKVPKEVSVTTHAALGFFTVNGITGALACDYGSGTIFSTAPSASLKIKMGTGDVIVEYPTLPKTPCPITITGGIVKADITLPAKALVQAKHPNSALVAFNNAFTEIKKGKEAHFKVTLATATGSCTLKKEL